MSMDRWRVAIVFAACLPTGFAAADGRDHAPKVSAIMNSADTAPRSEAQTDLFELVVTPGNGQLTLFLDRFASNEPVVGAKVEVESGNWKAVAQAFDNGSYRVNAPQFAKPGRYPLLVTVEAGADADLIETTLVVAEAAKSEAAVPQQGAGWLWWVGGALAALTALVTLSLLLKRRRAGRSGATPQQGT